MVFYPSIGCFGIALVPEFKEANEEVDCLASKEHEHQPVNDGVHLVNLLAVLGAIAWIT